MKKFLSSDNPLRDSPLRLICVIGLVLTLAISWGIVLSALFWRNPERANNQNSAFSKGLKEYDLADAPRRVMAGENPALIERQLSRLQKQAKSVEEHLSVLKRYRALSYIDRNYTALYANAASEAAGKFPYSGPLAAVAAEAVVLGGISTGEALSQLKGYTERLSQNRFGLLELSLNVLAGNLDNPASAAALAGFPDLLSLDLSAFPSQTQKDLLINDFLLLACRGEIPTASYRMNLLLNNPSPEITRMGAEFFFDHMNPLRAAELFLLLTEERDTVRAAEALALAGEISGARNIWFALASENQTEYTAGKLPMDPDTRLRIFYNLSSSSRDKLEKESWLEKIFVMPRQGPLDKLGIYSTIRYARLLDDEHSIAVLNGVNETFNGSAGRDPQGYPLLDLELLRRRQPNWPHSRAASEVWLLLGRHSENEDLHEWAAWYFEQQKLYPESQRLLKEAARKGMTGPWLDLHRSFALIREGKISEAEKILLQTASQPDWRFYANLGRIQESRGAISSALEYYENAAALTADTASATDLTVNKPSAAQLQMRISRCLQALGRSSESRRALETAYELDPDNINIRREVTRSRASSL